MRILVVGSGGREHAICWAINKSPKLTKLFCCPGNAGILQVAECIDINYKDFASLINFAKQNHIDLTICPMDEPLVLGIVDAFEAAGLKIFGPNKRAAIIEGSKAYSKDFMKRYNIDTAAYELFHDFEAALLYAKTAAYPLVVKADGTAAGKGVSICYNYEEAKATLKDIMVWKKFGDAGNCVVLEEFLSGVECSVLAFCDGFNLAVMPSAKDHKAAYNGDKGPNTGGMGVITPNPHYTDEINDICMSKIFLPTIEGLRKDNREFMGIMFFGLMLTKNGPKVLEYNVRPGDAETQTLLPLLQTDFLDIILSCLNKDLDKLEITWKNKSVACVVAASKGYPEKYSVGYPIAGLALQNNLDDTLVFHAGTKLKDNIILTNGGRVLNAVAMADSLSSARDKAYQALETISFTDIYYRTDIGKDL